MSGFDPVLALQTLAALAAGLALGLFHFHSLRRVTADYLEGNWKRAVAMQFARLAAMIALLFLLARLGALPLLAGAGGIVIARLLIVRKAKNAS